MRFWDASAIVPLLLRQAATDPIAAELDRDDRILAWWATEVECASAIARHEREGQVTPEAASLALARLAGLAATWQEVTPSQRVRQAAQRLLRVHPLRAADALQLAAAVVTADGEPGSMPFVTLDDRLAVAAQREGFPVVMPGA